MVIYEYTTNGLHILLAVVMIVLVAFFVLGVVRFFPLLKKSVALLIKPSEDIRWNQALAIAIFTFLLYGTFVLGIVFCTREAVRSIGARVDTSHPHTVSGQIEALNSEVLDYRGDILGYRLALRVDGQEYIIEDPPGISAESLPLLTTGTDVVLHYQEKGEAYIITKLELPS